MTRFDEFQKGLQIAPNILTRRLTALVNAGMLERKLYCERPPRFEYVLTGRGRDFRPVVIALQAWGNKHFAPEGLSVVLVDISTGAAAEPILIDRVSGLPITDATHRNTAGPAAGARVKKRLDRMHGTPPETASPPGRGTVAARKAKPARRNARGS